MSNIVYIATSLDGYIAGEDGNLDWLTSISNPDNSDFGFSDFIKRIDAVVMGRMTFETVAEFDEWPYDRPVYILSNTLNSLPEKYSGKAEVIKGEPSVVTQNLNEKGFSNLYIDGGKTIQGFLKQDLIDEMIITRVPVLLGRGIPLFGKNNIVLNFEHIETLVFTNMLVKSRYIRKR